MAFPALKSVGIIWQKIFQGRKERVCLRSETAQTGGFLYERHIGLNLGLLGLNRSSKE